MQQHSDFENLTLTEASGEIRKGKLSPMEYAQSLFARIDKVDPQVQAWVTMNREAVLAEARQCEAEARQKKFRGALHGIPIGVKDIFYTKGLRTTAGSRFFENFIPSTDAQAVARLRKAGAIILGKTVTTEFATFDPGPTRNPWNTGHTPGGSSSGSAAAVAARMCPGATGSQTVGSIGRPAAFCGVVGFMPTQRYVSREGVFPVSWSLDHVGCFGRSVTDIEVLLDAMSEMPYEKTPPPQRIRLGVLREFFYEKSTEEARALHEAVIKKLAGSKFEVVELKLPAIFGIATPSLMTIMRAEIASAHEKLHAQNASGYGKKLRALVETGMLIESQAYLRALRARRSYQREMVSLFKDVDVLLTPGALGPAPDVVSYTGDPLLSGPWTVADFPTLTLPVTLASNGLPVGIQLSAPPMKDGLLLEIGKAVEATIGFTEKPF